MAKRWVMGLLAASLIVARPVRGAEASIKKWSNRVIPLPQQLRVRGSRCVSSRDVALVLPPSEDPLLRTAAGILKPLAAGGKGFEIHLVLTAERSQCPRNLRSSLERVPNKDQAYAIRPVLRGGKFKGLLLAANTPLGLLYAARTLAELVPPPVPPRNTEEFPAVSVLDWPDIAERGEWFGYRGNPSALPDFQWMAERKFNVIELQFPLGFSDDGTPTVTVDRKMIAKAARLGIRIVPIIWHMEDLAETGIFHYYPQLACTPEPGKPLPADYEPGLSFSQPQTIKILSDWMREFLSIPGINEISVWLAEQNLPYLCPGKEPYVREVKGIQEAFERASQGRPGAVLQILTTQGSYPVNDKVLAAASPSTRIIYYDGSRTYNSSRRPMIYPLLGNFARSGRWLGVYPELTGSWRTVFPFTGPQFIHARMKEFADKRLSGMIGYATPSNRYYRFNVTAAAEWSWNSSGRSPRDFAEAYAHSAGIPQPKHFAEWAELVGNVGWDLAGSEVAQRLILDSSERTLFQNFGTHQANVEDLRPMEFGHGLLSEFPDRKSFKADMATAKRALKLAEAEGEAPMADESRSDIGELKLLDGLIKLSETRGLPQEQRPSAAKAALAEIDAAARMLSASVYQWGMAVNPLPQNALPSRLLDTVDFASNLANTAWEVGRQLGIKDPYPAYRLRRVRDWNAEDIPPGTSTTLWANITPLLDGPGNYDVQFHFLDGTVGLDVHSVALVPGPARSAKAPLDEARWNFLVGRYNRRVDYWISVPKGGASSWKSGEPLFLRMKVSAPSPTIPKGVTNKRTSQGVILMRKSWR